MSENNLPAINIDEAQSFIEAFLHKDIPINLVGPPGIGKSMLVKQIARKTRRGLVDIRLSQLEPTDFIGLPVRIGTGENVTVRTIPPDMFRPLIETDDPYILFLDELNLAPPPTFAACYKVVLDRMIGQEKLGPNVRIIAAGNRRTDKSSVHPLPGALRSRMAHVTLTTSLSAWLAYALEKRVHGAVVGYIKYRPDSLLAEPPANAENIWPNPRAWERVGNILDFVGIKSKTPMLESGISALVGREIAMEFTAFVTTYSQLPSYSRILDNPADAPVPKSDRPDQGAALAGMIWNNIDAGHIEPVLDYLSRIENREFRHNIITGLQRLPHLAAELSVNPTYARKTAEAYSRGEI